MHLVIDLSERPCKKQTGTMQAFQDLKVILTLMQQPLTILPTAMHVYLRAPVWMIYTFRVYHPVLRVKPTIMAL